MLLTLKTPSRAAPGFLLLIVFLCCCSSSEVNSATTAGVSVTARVTASQQSILHETVPATLEVMNVPGGDEQQALTSPTAATNTFTPTSAPTSTLVVAPGVLPPLRDMQAFVRGLAVQYALPFEQIPYDLKRNPPSYLPYYPGIPEVRVLRQQLRAADPQEKGIYVAQILAYLGVQTSEEVAGGVGPEVWVPKWHNYDENGTRILTCNTYAANAVRAIGLECCMSH